MIEQSKTTNKLPKIQYSSTTGWTLGTVSRLDDDRVPEKAISGGDNVTLKQNGTIGPRAGLLLYGTQPSYPILGQIYEFVKFDGTTPETWLITMQNVSGTGKIYVNKDGGAWTLCTGKTYDSTARAHFEQIAGKVLITNGVDNLSYLTIDDLSITPFTALSTPTITSATPTGLSGSTTTYRYKITATNQGETAASAASTAAVGQVRALWDGTTKYVTLVFPRVSGASRYNIYVGDQAGYEYYLDTVVDPGTGSNVTYIDTGQIAENVLRIAPVGDSTAGPKTTRSTNIKGQVYMVGDTENPGRIWFGGTNTISALDFSSFNGGGWVEPNSGGKDFPVVMKPFRDGKGTPMAVCLTKGTNGSGKRLLLQGQTTTVGTTIITYMNVTEDNGQDGTDSPDGVASIDDGLFYPSREDFKTSTTKVNIQNIISTTGIGNNISDAINSLVSTNMDLCVQMVNDRKVHWALPFQSTTNNQVWILDLRQNGAWMRPWHIAADWMTLYTDNSTGQTKRLFLVDDQIYEMSDAVKTNDNGVAFPTSISSGAIKFSEDGEQYGQVIDVTFVFLRPQGLINLNVVANTEDGPIVLTDTLDTVTNNAISGWGAYGWSDNGWSNLLYGEPLSVSSSIPRVRQTIDVDEEVNYILWGVNSTESGVDYELAVVIIRYAPVGWVEID